jgi:hypothetical protein
VRTRLAFLLTGLCVFAVGCTSQPPAAQTDESPNSPLARHFSSYTQLFRLIAANEMDLPTDSETVLTLAAQSDFELYVTDSRSVFAVITPHYYVGNAIDQLRGASGNGNFYVVRLNLSSGLADEPGRSPPSLDLLGVAEGNSFRWSSENDQQILITTWHMSAEEHLTHVYVVAGNVLQPRDEPQASAGDH